MTISKRVSHFSKSGNNAATETSFNRIRQAVEDHVPLDQLVLQLRQMSAEPHERLSEARFDGTLDILGQQKAARKDELDSVGRSVLSPGTRLEEDHQILSGLFSEALAKAKGELEEKIDTVADHLRSAIDEQNHRLRAFLHELSTSFTSHIVEEEIRRDEDRGQVMTALEQRIAQWRAEIDDRRRDGKQDAATSMVDVGQRLMALRQLSMQDSPASQPSV